jgi:hypothetical protein
VKEPTRLMQGSGPARELMTGAELRVPSDARRRALQFTGVAAGLTASSTAAAAAGATSLVKTLVLTLSLGAAGGGLTSLALSTVYSHYEHAKVEEPQPPPFRSPAPVHRGDAAVGAPIASPAAASEPSTLAAEASAGPAPLPGNANTSGSARPSTKATTDAVAPPGASVVEFRDPPARPSLFEEQRSIESARAAVARGDATGALSLLDAYDRRYAQKQFGPEALALRVQALAARGERAAASALAHDFAKNYPHHPLLSRVQSSASH